MLAGCADKEPPARTVTEFVDNPILLEAAMVRCSRDRNETRYQQECINAREAVNRIEAKEEAVRRAELEARSESKRKALRRMQEAQAEARRRAEEAERLREEAEYLAQFGVLPPSEEAGSEEELPAGYPRGTSSSQRGRWRQLVVRDGHAPHMQVALRKRYFDFFPVERLVNSAVQLVLHASAIGWIGDPAE